jgi:PAS domain-containing protein
VLLLFCWPALGSTACAARPPSFSKASRRPEQQRSLTEFRNRELSDEITRREAWKGRWPSEQRWQLAVAGTKDGIRDWNIVTGELFMSDRWLAMLGYRPGDLAANIDAWSEVLHPQDKLQTLARLQAHLAGETPFSETEFRLRCADGGYRWFCRGKARPATRAMVRMTNQHRCERTAQPQARCTTHRTAQRDLRTEPGRLCDLRRRAARALRQPRLPGQTGLDARPASVGTKSSRSGRQPLPARVGVSRLAAPAARGCRTACPHA